MLIEAKHHQTKATATNGAGRTVLLRTLAHPAGAPLAQQAAESGAACKHHAPVESHGHHVYAPQILCAVNGFGLDQKMYVCRSLILGSHTS